MKIDCSLKKNFNTEKCKMKKSLGDINNPIMGGLRSSFRNFDVGSEFKEAINRCNKKENPLERSNCRSNVRGIHRFVESGRLNKMGDSIHDFISRLDEDEVKSFKNKFPGATKIANEFAAVEDLREF